MPLILFVPLAAWLAEGLWRELKRLTRPFYKWGGSNLSEMRQIGNLPHGEMLNCGKIATGPSLGPCRRGILPNEWGGGG